jgi:hypothetical protein
LTPGQPGSYGQGGPSGPPPQQPGQYGSFSAGPPPLPGAYGADPASGYGGVHDLAANEERVSGGGGRAIWLGALAVALLLVGGGGFLAWRALQSTGGAASPGEAMESLLLALNEEDFLSVGELLEPGERRTLVDPVVSDILPELERLGLLEDADPGDVSGLDIELTDVTYDIEPVAGHDDIVHIYVTGGESSSTSVADELPWGEALRSLADADLEDSTTSETIERPDAPLVMVQRNDRWYLSLWYTVAEAGRLDTGNDLPDVAAGPAPQGSDSPEAAVEAMVQELVDLDLRGIVSRIDPEEGAALYRYAPLFIDEAQDALDEVTDGAAFTWEITDLGFDTETDGDDATVTIREATLTVTTSDVVFVAEWSRESLVLTLNGTIDGRLVDGTFESTPDSVIIRGVAGDDAIDVRADFDIEGGEYSVEGTVTEGGEEQPLSGSLTLSDDGCSEFSFEFQDERESGCLEEFLELSTDEIADFRSQIDQVAVDELPGIAIRTHRTDGGWYVSPTLTTMNWVTTYMQGIDKEDIDALVDTANGEGVLGGASLGPVLDLEGAISGGELSFPDDEPMDDPFEMDEAMDEPMDEPDETFDDDLTYFAVDVSPTSDPLASIETMNDREVHEYVIFMEAGQTLAVTVYGSSRVENGIEDPVLVLFQDGVGEVASADDEDGFDSILGYTADSDGFFILQVYEYSVTGGQYELTLELDAPGVTPDLLNN